MQKRKGCTTVIGLLSRLGAAVDGVGGQDLADVLLPRVDDQRQVDVVQRGELAEPLNDLENIKTLTLKAAI